MVLFWVKIDTYLNIEVCVLLAEEIKTELKS